MMEILAIDHSAHVWGKERKGKWKIKKMLVMEKLWQVGNDLPVQFHDSPLERAVRYYQFKKRKLTSTSKPFVRLSFHKPTF